MDNILLQRRQVFQSLIALSAVGGLAACGGAQEAPAESSDLSSPATSGFLTAQEMALISAIAGTIIPTTDTASAVEAGVPETLRGLVDDWGDDAYRQYWRGGLGLLDTALRGDGATSFQDMLADQRVSVLQAYDAGVFDGEIEDGFYRDFKATVVQAYYMSEPGATEDLAYEPVPGDWIGCVPLSDYPKNWAT